MFTEITDNIERTPAWGWMWLFAVAVYVALKLVTLADHEWTWGYLLAWPGMDATAFLKRRNVGFDGRPIKAVACLVAGIVCVIVARWNSVLIALAIPLMLHFGVFDLLAWGWRRNGVMVRPIMDRPMAAVNLADFWSRWNTAVRDLGNRFVFRPIARRMRATTGLMATFLASGLIHDLVLSVPARGGYGLPTIYFLIQGAGILLEKTLHLKGLGAKAFMFAVLAAPLPLLIHGAFRSNVLAPFARDLGRLITW